MNSFSSHYLNLVNLFFSDVQVKDNVNKVIGFNVSKSFQALMVLLLLFRALFYLC